MTEAEIKKIVQNTVESAKNGKLPLTLAKAEKLCGAVLAEAERMGVKAVVCVSDGGGNPRLVKAMDDSYIASYDIALGKAYTAVALKTSTAKLKPLAQPNCELYGIQFTNGGKIVVFGGGEPLCGKNGEIVGGLGVSGGSEAEDTALSAFGKRYFETEI